MEPRIGLTPDGICDGTAIRAIRAAWDTLQNKDELYMAAAAVDAIKKAGMPREHAAVSSPQTPPRTDTTNIGWHERASHPLSPEPAPEIDWLTIASMLCLNCDIEHDGELVMPGELAKFLEDTYKQTLDPLPSSPEPAKNESDKEKRDATEMDIHRAV